MSKHKKGKKSKSKKNELTYFLDHPDIKRHESPGNGSSPTVSAPSTNVKPSAVRSGNVAGSVKSTGGPSIASQIGFGTKK